MKTTTVRFGRDLWGLLEREAAGAGVTVSQYIRDAALARAVAAAAARGEGPFDLLAGAVREALRHEPSSATRMEAERHLAALARLLAAERMGEARALAAQSEQAVRRSRRLVQARERGDPQRADGETNIEYVARLWEAFRTGGVARLAELVPADVEWRPFQAGRKALRGTPELNDFWDSRPVEPPTPSMFHALGDDVLVRAERRLPDGGLQTLWSLYRFAGTRLIQAVTFEREAEALDYARAARGSIGGTAPE